jgi:hypothetical protein
MITLQEELLSFAEAAKRLPGRPHLSTIFRWVSNGVRGRILETLTIGGRRYTSRKALERFCAASPEARPAQPALPSANFVAAGERRAALGA